MFSKTLVLAGFCLCAQLAASQQITRIETLTADESGAQMTFGEIRIDIIAATGASCRIDELDSGGNNFQQGELDVFQGEQYLTAVKFCLLFVHCFPLFRC